MVVRKGTPQQLLLMQLRRTSNAQRNTCPVCMCGLEIAYNCIRIRARSACLLCRPAVLRLQNVRAASIWLQKEVQ